MGLRVQWISPFLSLIVVEIVAAAEDIPSFPFPEREALPFPFFPQTGISAELPFDPLSPFSVISS